MLIKGNIIDVIERRIYPGELRIEKGEIVSVKEILEEVEVYIMPGFIDSHVHIESSMLTPAEFARAAVKRGTVAVLADPHEIANVLGVDGIDFMIESGNSVPLKFYFGLPSCVPATDFESSGARIDSDLISKLIVRKDIWFLAEMMNYPGVVYGDNNVMDKILAAQKAGKPIDGHAPGLRGEDLAKYVEAGISTDHEAATIEEAVEKINLGMKIQIREGSAARNLMDLAPLFNEYSDELMLCSDDIHPEMLDERHINGPVKYLIDKGYDLFKVLRAVSFNPVKHYGIDVGLLRKGDKADFIIIDNPDTMNVKETWIDGQCVYRNGEVLFNAPKGLRPNIFNSSEILALDIEVENKARAVRIIEVKDGDLITGSSIEKWSNDTKLMSSVDRDILKLVVKDRYNDKPARVGFIRGFNLKRGAFASSVAHDSHNLIAVGVDDKSIIKAMNVLIKSGGGLAVVDGKDMQLLELPIAGLMSDVPCGTIARDYLKLSEQVTLMGSYLKAPFMTLSFMALLVIPELKLGDGGLFDGNKFAFTELFVEENQA